MRWNINSQFGLTSKASLAVRWSILWKIWTFPAPTTSCVNRLYTCTKPKSERFNKTGELLPTLLCNCLLWYGTPLWKPYVRRLHTLRCIKFWSGAGAVPKLILCKTPNIAMSRRNLKGARLKWIRASLIEMPSVMRNSFWISSINFKMEGAAW